MIDAVRVPDLDQAKIFYAAQARFDMTICYCSVYNECWIALRQDPNVEYAERCDTARAVPFEKQM